MMANPAAFLSYARQDDDNNDGHLSELRGLLEREMRCITGESDFKIFQDREDVAWGQQFQNVIDESIDGSVLLIPIISPLFFKRQACRDELERFLELEKQRGRNDLILSIYFINVPNFSPENADELVATIAKRQYRDWRSFRHEFLGSSESKKRIADLAMEMNNALCRAPTAKELELRRKTVHGSRLGELQNSIGGPFRSNRVLQKLNAQLNSVGIDTLERLLNHSEQELRMAGLQDETIQIVIDDLAKYGHHLRNVNEPVHPLDKLVLTPNCRNAVRKAGIETLEELASKSWNDLMLTGHFLPNLIEEVSLRLQAEAGRDIRQTSERRHSYEDVLARGLTPQ